jgi:hypothetical protein
MKHYEHAVGAARDKKIILLTSELGGEAGFAWFTLLEWLAEAQNTFCIIFIDKCLYKRFATETNISPTKLKKIFKMMAELELIDPELFDENIIVSQNFIKKHINYLRKLTIFRNFSEENLENKLKIYFKYRDQKDISHMTYKTFIQKLINIFRPFENSIPNVQSQDDASQQGGLKSELENSNLAPPREAGINSLPNEQNQNNGSQQGGLKGNGTNTTPSPMRASTSAPSNREGIKPLSERWQYQVAELMYKHIKERDETFPKPNLQEWANGFDEIAKTGRGRNEIEQVMLFSQQDKFWACHILDPKILLKHFSRIKLIMQKNETDIQCACYTYEQACKLIQKDNRQWNEFIYCQDKNNQKIYWDTKKGPCPYEKVKKDIIAWVRKINDFDNIYTWNITKLGTKLPEGYYYKSIYQGEEEYKASGLNLQFYLNDLLFNETELSVTNNKNVLRENNSQPCGVVLPFTDSAEQGSIPSKTDENDLNQNDGETAFSQAINRIYETLRAIPDDPDRSTARRAIPLSRY